MTSGEVTHRCLSNRPSPEWRALGTTCLHITWGARGAVDIASLGLRAVTHPAEADFILAHGTEGLGLPDGGVQPRTAAQLRKLLEECAADGGRKLPMIVVNPDVVTVDGCVTLQTRSSLQTTVPFA